MSLSNYDCAEQYAEGIKPKGESNHMWYIDTRIYSYGEHFPIAFKIGKKKAYFNTDGYSSTTTRHKSAVRNALESRGYKLVEVGSEKIRDLIWNALNKEDD